MAFSMRVSAVLLTAFVAFPGVPDAAQRLNPTDANDFLMFRHTVAVRRNARMCERHVPDYRQAFAPLYTTWSEKHREEIARGETLFRLALTANDPARYPYVDRTLVTTLKAGLDELAKPPQALATPPPPRMAETCDKLLTFLKQN
jgi:hypothetical protein